MTPSHARLRTAFCVGVGLLLASTVTAGEPKETRMTMKSLPAAVRKTATEQTKGATILKIIKEIDGEETVYELATKRNGRTRDIIIATDGTLMVAEEQVEMTELPPAVQKTFEKNIGKGRILVIEEVYLAGKLAYYEAQVRTGKEISEVKVGLDGKLLPVPKVAAKRMAR